VSACAYIGLLLVGLLAAACDGGEKPPRPPTGVGGDGGVELPDAGPPLDCTKTGPDQDADRDLFSPNSGDCDDCKAAVNPHALDIPDNGVDDDCKGGDATALEPPCDGDLEATSVDGEDIARTLGLCRVVSKGSRDYGVISARLATLDREEQIEDSRQVWLPQRFGTLSPASGSRLVVLSTGVARDLSVDSYTEGCDTFDSERVGLGWTLAHAPPPGFPKDSSECEGVTSTDVAGYNAISLELEVRAPSNAKAFTFDSIFFTYEYPYFVCEQFNDFFAVFADPAPSDSEDDNVLFDENGDAIGVNSGLLQVCRKESGVARDIDCALGPDLLAGTGYDRDESTCVSETDDKLEDRGGASTGWLRTSVPIKPSQFMTLRFVLWDSGDPLLDSTVVLDNFQWVVKDAPSDAVTTPIAGP
jgi:hypothetical protein